MVGSGPHLAPYIEEKCVDIETMQDEHDRRLVALMVAVQDLLDKCETEREEDLIFEVMHLIERLT